MATGKKKGHTISDYLDYKKLSGTAISTEYIAYVVAENYKSPRSDTRTYIEIANKRSGNIIRKIRSHEKSYDLPNFFEDGDKFTFLEKSKESCFLCITRIGEEYIEKILLPSAPVQFAVTEDKIILLMKEQNDERTNRKFEIGDDGYFFEENEKFSSIYVYESGEGLKKLTQNIQVWEFSCKNDLVVFVGSDSPLEDSWYGSQLYIQTLDSSRHEHLYDPKPRTVTRPKISNDKRKIAFLMSHWSDRGFTAGDLIILDLKTKTADNITDGNRRSYTDLQWSKIGDIFTLFNEQGKVGISRYDGAWSDVWSTYGTTHSHFAPSFEYDGKTFYLVFSNHEKAQEVYSVGQDGYFEAITSCNKSLNSLKSYPFEIVNWNSTDNLSIWGILRSSDKNMPLIVDIHGGPTSCSTLDFIDNSTIFLAEGFSVFRPNYRGSTGMGRRFAESNIGDMGGMDIDDIFTGIDFLLKSGRIETDRIFVIGGSYGGFLTDLIITKTNRFRAAVSLFGISDWMSFHGTTNATLWDSTYYKSSVYGENLQRKYSPILYAKKIQTPLLLIQGVNDPVVPVGQSVEMYRALKEDGKKVRLLLFPREGHGFREKAHIEMSLGETIKWFKSFL